MTRVWKFGADVDTDQIVPGRYAPYMRPDADVGDAAFIEARPEFAKNAQPGDIIVAAENFGCGSSREYAVEALRRRKVGAIIALSFARIFFRNALNLGIPLFVAPEIVSGLKDGEEVTVDLDHNRIVAGERAYDLPELPDFAREILSAGGIVNYVKQYGRFPGEAPREGG
ncbi:MAG TPA: 3-isopropylmalate dehydratase [Anaerolineaceae bacterium]